MRINSLLQAGVTNRQRKRSKQSYPTNLSGNIPGTSIGRGEGLSGWKNLARQGRRGDSALRDVGGQPSHVSKKEAKVIDSLGPLGEAWVESIGSGTRNPRTGLKEYYIENSSFDDWSADAIDTTVDTTAMDKTAIAPSYEAYATASAANNAVDPTKVETKDYWSDVRWDNTWRPMDGSWGIFGSTKAHRERERKAKEAARRRAQFDTFMTGNKETDFAEMFVKQGGLDGIWDEKLDENHFGLNKADFKKYVNPYDTRGEDETRDDTERVLETAGTKVDTGLFGLLTKSSEIDTKQDLIDTGDFHENLAEENLLKTAHTEAEGAIDASESKIQDERDDYNKEFWTGMTNFNKAVNA